MALGTDIPSPDLGIVRELSERPQWVAWKATPTDDGKIRKLPISPLTGRNAQVTNPLHWAFFAEACKYALTTDVNGIGFVLTGLEGYTVIDLDKVRDPDTGIVEPWACDLVEQFNTYTEISPSGTGLHLWCRGRPPGSRCKSKNIEMYTQKRYVTITGQMVPECESDEIEDRQKLIEQLYEETFDTAPVHGDPPAINRPAPERDTQSDYDARGWPYPCKQQWHFEEALGWCQKAMADGIPRVPHSKILALHTNDKLFGKIWRKQHAPSIKTCGDDVSRWDLALANRLFIADMELTWEELIAVLVEFRSQYDSDNAKMQRADYWARTIVKASDQVSFRKEREAEKVADEIAIHAMESLEHRIDRAIEDGTATKSEKKAVLDELCSTVGIPRILRITRAKQKNNHIFTIHFGEEDHDKLDGDATLLTSQTKFRNAVASQLLQYIKQMTAKKWSQAAGLLLKAVEEEDGLPSVATQEQTIELLQGYLTSVPRPPEFASETYLQDGPWWFKGKLVIKLSSFEIYLRRIHRMGIPRMELARRLRDIGVRMEIRSYRVGDKVSSLSSYVVPDENNFHDLANSVPRTIEMLSDGESEEEKA